MTKRGFFTLILLATMVLCAVFVWPTRYKMLDTPATATETALKLRVDRINGRIDKLGADGAWVEYVPPAPEYDVRRDSDAGRGVNQAQRAGDDIRKMNEVAKKATEQ